MGLFTILVLLFTASQVVCLDLPDPNFVADIVEIFNRKGVIYHLPPMLIHDVQRYHKLTSKLM